MIQSEVTYFFGVKGVRFQWRVFDCKTGPIETDQVLLLKQPLQPSGSGLEPDSEQIRHF